MSIVWEDVKAESIEAINEIVDNGEETTSTVIVGEHGLSEAKLNSIDWNELCSFYLQNYKLACNELDEDEDSALVSKAETFIG